MSGGGNLLFRLIGVIIAYLPLTPIWLIFWGLVVGILCGCGLEDKFMRRNGFQACIMGAIWIVVLILAVIPIIGWILNLIWFLCIIAMLIVNVLHCSDGKFVGFPIIGDFVEQI